VLRQMDLGEADRLLTLFAPAYGKIKAIAKGARKPASRKAGHVGLFSRTELLIARGRNLDIIQQAELIDPFLVLHEDLNRAAYANYVVELLDKFIQDEDAHPRLYDLLVEALGWLCDPELDPMLVARFYEMQLLNDAGFRPELFTCLGGGEPVKPQPQFFASTEGGILCPDHADGYGRLTPVTLNALKALRFIQSRDFRAVRALQLSPALHNELERIMQGYLTYLLEQRVQSAAFIRRLHLG
jgi:DNA repair protein RecO (recombination protein O)